MHPLFTCDATRRAPALSLALMITHRRTIFTINLQACRVVARRVYRSDCGVIRVLVRNVGAAVVSRSNEGNQWTPIGRARSCLDNEVSSNEVLHNQPASGRAGGDAAGAPEGGATAKGATRMSHRAMLVL